MKASFFMIVLALLLTATGAGLFYWAGDSSPPAMVEKYPPTGRASVPPGPSTAVPKPHGSTAVNAAIRAETPPAPVIPYAQLEQRIVALESQVKSLQQTLSGVSLEKASADRQRLFAAEEGYLKADEYAAAGQHAIAGEGYLTFLQHHPYHADARDVMKKARDAFLKAGYKDKAFWVQDEMMKANPQHQRADLEELAHLEKDAGLYDRAMEHMNQSAQLDPDVGSRLWKRMYWAWFVQLQNGSAAGIEALRQVQQEIAASGINDPKLNQRAQDHLAEWQRQLARGQ